MLFRFSRPTLVLAACAILAVALEPSVGQAGSVVIVGTGAGSLRHNGTTKIDITDPNNNSVIDTFEWGAAPSMISPVNTVGVFNSGDGETWAKVFDNAVGGAGPWGTGNSKTCCSFSPGATSLTMNSANFGYELTGYTMTNGNDSPDRRPTGWRVFGSNDNFATSTLLDTVTAADINGGAGWTADNQVGEVTFGSPTAAYKSIRITFDTSVTSPQFQLGEVELLGTTAHVAGDSVVGNAQVAGTVQNTVGGARFVRVSEIAGGTDSRFHVSEIEVFSSTVVPDAAGGASFNGPNLSTNDYIATGFHAATTSSVLEHGAAAGVFDGDHESGGAVWSVASGQAAPNPRYTLDLGASLDIGQVRVFPRNEACCEDRFANLRVELFADAAGAPGALISSFDGPTNAPGGTNAALLAAVSAPITSGDYVASLFLGTYMFEINPSAATNDTITVAGNPVPGIFTDILDVNGADLVFDFVNSAPLEQGDFWQVLIADEFIGPLGSISATGLPGIYNLDSSRLLIDGTVSLVFAPEPASVALWGLVAAMAAGTAYRVRRKRAA